MQSGVIQYMHTQLNHRPLEKTVFRLLQTNFSNIYTRFAPSLHHVPCPVEVYLVVRSAGQLLCAALYICFRILHIGFYAVCRTQNTLHNIVISSVLWTVQRERKL